METGWDIKQSLDEVASAIIQKIGSSYNEEKYKNVFFRELEDWWSKLNSSADENWDIIQYLNIFNESVSFFASRISKSGKPFVVRRRPELEDSIATGERYVSSQSSVGALFRKQSVFSEMYQWTYNEDERLLKDWINYYSIQSGDTIKHSKPLEAFLTKDKKSSFTDWSKNLSSIYTTTGGEISHFVYLIGPTAFTFNTLLSNEKDLEATEDKLSKYILRVNVGFKIPYKGEGDERVDVRESKRGFAKKLLKGLLSFVNKLTTYFVVRQMAAEQTRQATRAAIAQAFARNKNHNIGSHVLVNCTNKDKLSHIGFTSLILRENAYKSSFKEITDQHKSETDAKAEVKKYISGLPLEYSSAVNVIADHLNGFANSCTYGEGNIGFYPSAQLATFFLYLLNRDAYLSEATYGVANLVGVRRVYAELFKEFDNNRLLLNHISGINNFSFTIKFQINGEDLNEENDIYVSLPGDILGAQAFYNILENLIRNSAKHNASEENEKRTFTVNFFEPEGMPDAHKFYGVEISDNVMFDKKVARELVKKMNTKIGQSVLDASTMSLRSNSLGLLEMEASAAFLRQIDLPEIESDTYNIVGDAQNGEADKCYLLQASLKYGGERQSKAALAYRFYVKKVEKFLLITNEKKYSRLEQKEGLTFMTPEEFLDSLIKENTTERYSHEFVLWLDDRDSSAQEEQGCDVTASSSCAQNHSQAKDDKAKALKALRDKLAPFFVTCRDDKKQIRDKERPQELSLLPERLMRVEDNVKAYLNKGPDEFDLKDFEREVWGQWEVKNVCLRNSLSEQFEKTHQIILFDHLTAENNESWTSYEAGYKRMNKRSYCEILSSETQRKLPKYPGTMADYISLLKKPENLMVRQKLWEAYDTRVVAVDERLQEFAERKHGNHEDIFEKQILKHANVIMPDRNPIDLACRNYDQALVNCIEEFIKREVKGQNTDYFLIHYGIVERMYKTSEAIHSKLEEWAKYSRLVVTTGRGKHSMDRLPLSACYLNLPAVLNAFRDNRSKYSIHSVLNQSRR